MISQPIDELLELARVADECGYEGVLVADHVALPTSFDSVHPSGATPFAPSTPFPDAIVSIAAMAAVTERLKFMSYVYVLPMREPLSVAKQVGTLAALFPGRIVFGVGAGWLN